MSDILGIDQSGGILAAIEKELDKASPTRRQRILDAITLAALGSIPWVGGVLAAAATFKTVEAGVRQDDLRMQWLHEHLRRLDDLRATLNGIFARLDNLGTEIEDRIGSEQYLAIVRKAFREWDQADTQQKRDLIVHLITNAAGTRVCSDDILRLFLDWIELYHEAHFAVIREIHANPGSTRYDIWISVYGPEIPRDDSADADLFKMLIRDLNTGGVIRLPRESDDQGRFKKKARNPGRATKSATMESAFEDSKSWVLTQLGGQFVHYAMSELVTRIESTSGTSDGHPSGTE